MSRGRLALVAGLVLAGVAVSLLLWSGRGPPRGEAGRISLAPRPPGVAGEGTAVAAGGGDSESEAVGPESFIGPDACRECHADRHRAWAASTHGTAGGEPGPEVVVAPFEGEPIRFRDATVTPVVEPDGSYAFEVTWEGERHRLAVDGVVGRGHMVGGGTQGFLTHEPDGTYRLLPFDFSVTDGRWFCNTIGRAGRGWVPIGPELRLADCTDWPPARVLGQIRRYTNCQECHGSLIRVVIGRGAPRFDTRFASLAIDCESCHGPARRHVELARSGSSDGMSGDGAAGEAATDLGIRSLSALSEDASLRVCFRCHALKDALEPGYLPGRPLERHYALAFPILGDRPYFPDGRVRTFAYQETHLWADCYLNGRLTCVDCHDPHSGAYRDVNRRALAGRFDDGQCTGCHASKAERPERHTHHAPDSPGSRCVVCHMPYLQQPMLGEAIPYARSDHTIPVPRPRADSALGIRPACASCHQERSASRLQAETERWWGSLKPRKALVAGLLAAEEMAASGEGDLGRTTELLLRPEEPFGIARFAGLAHLVETYLGPDMERLEESTRRRLERLASTDDLEVQALALAALHLARGEDPRVRRFLRARLDVLGSREAAVRARWALALGHLGDSWREAGELSAALATYAKALEVRPDDPLLHFARGLARAAAGDLEGAERAYRESLELEPNQPLVHVNLGIARAAGGRPAEAEAAYRRASELDPHEELAWFNLGNLHLRAGRAEPAIEAYTRALEAAPGLPEAWFNLARAQAAAGRFAEALEATVRGLRFDPEHEAGRELRRALERPRASR